LFAVAGTQKALAFGINPFVSALLGMLTGIGGGVLRDLLVNEIPVVLRTDLYALAALAGAAVVVGGLFAHWPPTATTIAGDPVFRDTIPRDPTPMEPAASSAALLIDFRRSRPRARIAVSDRTTFGGLTTISVRIAPRRMLDTFTLARDGQSGIASVNGLGQNLLGFVLAGASYYAAISLR